ncbi:MAG: PP2C family protein-serine/threonine phosphatase [Bryobacteraceae bacterium]
MNSLVLMLLATLRERKDAHEAAAVQRNLLPREIPRIPGCGIALVWRPAMDLSGDYVDVLQPLPGRLCIAIADVVGKGAGAALLMSNVQAAVRLLAGDGLAPRELTARLNRNISASLGSGKFITFFYGEMRGRRLFYTNAGHPAPVLVRAGGEVVRLEEGGAVLGVFDTWQYGQGEIELAAGDRLILFTDGLTEAGDFGEERLIEVLRASRRLGAHGIQKKVMSALAGYEVTDDLTLLTLAIE